MWLAESGWEEDVRWDSEGSRSPSSLHLDLNDPDLIFQLIHPTQDLEQVDRAAALVLPPQPKAGPAELDPVANQINRLAYCFALHQFGSLQRVLLADPVVGEKRLC